MINNSSMSPRETIIFWIAHIDQDRFLENVRGQELPKNKSLIRKFTNVAYEKIHFFMDKNKTSLEPIDSDAIERLGERVTSVGLYRNHHDPKVKELFDLADRLKLNIQLLEEESKNEQRPRPKPGVFTWDNIEKTPIVDYDPNYDLSLLKERLEKKSKIGDLNVHHGWKQTKGGLVRHSH